MSISSKRKLPNFSHGPSHKVPSTFPELSSLSKVFRQTMNCGYDPARNGLAERWVGIIKVWATALLADVRLPPEYWSYARRWVACVHTHSVVDIPLDKSLPTSEM